MVLILIEWVFTFQTTPINVQSEGEFLVVVINQITACGILSGPWLVLPRIE